MTGSTSPPPARTLKTGFQYTPGLSNATCIHPPRQCATPASGASLWSGGKGPALLPPRREQTRHPRLGLYGQPTPPFVDHLPHSLLLALAGEPRTRKSLFVVLASLAATWGGAQRVLGPG